MSYRKTIREMRSRCRLWRSALDLNPGDIIDGYVVTHTVHEFGPGHLTVSVTLVPT